MVTFQATSTLHFYDAAIWKVIELYETGLARTSICLCRKCWRCGPAMSGISAANPVYAIMIGETGQQVLWPTAPDWSLDCEDAQLPFICRMNSSRFLGGRTKSTQIIGVACFLASRTCYRINHIARSSHFGKTQKFINHTCKSSRSGRGILLRLTSSPHVVTRLSRISKADRSDNLDPSSAFSVLHDRRF